MWSGSTRNSSTAEGAVMIVLVLHAAAVSIALLLLKVCGWCSNARAGAHAAL